MAKAKSTTPDKALSNRTRSSPNPPVPLRRSTRQAVKSAKKIAAEALSKPAKVVKKKLPTKGKTSAKTASSKAVKKSPEKGSPPKKPPANKAAAKKTPAEDAGNTTTAPEPKPRGRSKKTTTADTPFPVGKKRGSKTLVAAPVNEDQWTDSPKKNQRNHLSHVSMNSPSALSNNANAAPQCDTTGRTGPRQASVGGVRKSIEPPGSPSGRSQQRARSASRSPSTSGETRNASAGSIKTTKTGRSTSPAETASKTKAKNSSSRARTRSATRTSNPDQSKSPSAGAPVKPLQVKKTRSSRSKTKSPNRSRGVSPSKNAPALNTTGNSSRRSQSTTRPRSASPKKPPPSKAEVRFLQRLREEDEYGETLRDIEVEAYEAELQGRDPPVRDPMVNREDERRAIEHGVQRARFQGRVSSSPDTSDRPSLRGGRSDGRSHSPGQKRARGSSRRSPSYDARAFKLRKDVNEDEDGDEIVVASKPFSSNRRSIPGPRADNQSPRRKFSRADTHRSRESSVATEEYEPLPLDRPSAPGRGTVRSCTNPEFTPGTTRPNPFFETMPGPEIWHRRMPPYLPFGDTPLMERIMSNQFDADLARGEERRKDHARQSSGLFSRATESVKSTFTALGQSVWGAPTINKPDYATPWELPHVEETEVQQVLKELHQSGKDVRGADTTGMKRKLGDAESGAAGKRVRRRS